MELRCHSFLRVYIRNIIYGRSFASGKELCDGEKPDDTTAPDNDCFDEEGKLSELMRQACHGKASCESEIPTLPLDETCNALKREARLEYICGILSYIPLMLFVYSNMLYFSGLHCMVLLCRRQCLYGPGPAQQPLGDRRGAGHHDRCRQEEYSDDKSESLVRW